ncbi:class I SAM-dependent methyltransferase [Scopulibacillus darangshiensis]|uniref:class I SAM-dependent methyltransferase n=1 Tax=Scopulibacillus darangshiensis TaxID=442528 RepID=UPI003C72E638
MPINTATSFLASLQSESATHRSVVINFIHKNIFDLDIEEGKYDIVYDSGCFHHIAPQKEHQFFVSF